MLRAVDVRSSKWCKAHILPVAQGIPLSNASIRLVVGAVSKAIPILLCLVMMLWHRIFKVCLLTPPILFVYGYRIRCRAFENVFGFLQYHIGTNTTV